MRFSAPRVSKAVAAVALMAVGALIAVSLMADVRGASAQIDNSLPFFVRDNLDRMTDEQVKAYCERPESEIRLKELPAITIDENPTPGMALVDYDACDADGDDLTFIIRSEIDSTLFDLNEETGALSVSSVAAEAAKFDYESKASYSVEVEVVDSIAGHGQMRQEIHLNDIIDNFLPFFVRDNLDRMTDEQVKAYCERPESEIRLKELPAITIDENPTPGMALVDYDACDADGDDLTFIIRSEIDSTLFDLNEETGALSVSSVAAEAAKFDYEAEASYSVEVEVVDSIAGHGQMRQEIRLNDVNENITPTRTAAPTATPTSIPGSAVTVTPTRTPGRVSQDVLHRVGALEQLLARLQTLIQSLQGVIAAQDSRIAAQDDRIAALEAQMAAGALTPTPTPQPTATPSPTPTMTPEPTPASSACVQAMQPGSVSGSWSSACLTANPTHGNTYYARFYTFTLDAAADVTITLRSDKPPYLYLLAGAGTSGDVLQQAGGDGQTSVAITDTLRAGSYTIEASTWRPKTLGDFTLTLTARE